MTAPRRVHPRSRTLLFLVVPPFLVLAFLVVMRGSVTVRPFEVAWCCWIGAVIVTSIGIGYGIARARH
ncbi:membrane protein [Mycobacterium phage Knocker]|nr:membrane protein [Mycobacterium phage Knocker]